MLVCFKPLNATSTLCMQQALCICIMHSLKKKHAFITGISVSYIDHDFISSSFKNFLLLTNMRKDCTNSTVTLSV
jgi:hypothetical protein